MDLNTKIYEFDTVMKKVPDIDGEAYMHFVRGNYSVQFSI